MTQSVASARRRGASVVEYVSVMAIGAAVLAGGALAVGDLSEKAFANAGQILVAGAHA